MGCSDLSVADDTYRWVMLRKDKEKRKHVDRFSTVSSIDSASVKSDLQLDKRHSCELTSTINRKQKLNRVLLMAPHKSLPSKWEDGSKLKPGIDMRRMF